MNDLNFGWLIDARLAGSGAPMDASELDDLRAKGIQAVVRLAHPETDPLVIEHVQVAKAGLEDLHIPVRDFDAPTLEQVQTATGFIQDQLRAGRPVAVSCAAGFGRTGTVLACYLVATGMSATAAIQAVRTKRPGSIETKEQEGVIHDLERNVRAGVAPS